MSKRPPARVRRAAETNEAVENILAASNQLWAHLGRGIPEAQENVRRLRRGEPAWWPPAVKAQISPFDLAALMDYIARQAVVDLWRQQGRIAYDINPEMAAQLYRADLRGKLPGGLFERLPHISPLIPLPRPWPFRSTSKREGLIRAYFLTGYVGQSVCPTTDPRRDGLAVMPWIEWSGKAATDGFNAVATPLFALPNTEQPFTLDDVIDHTNSWQGTATDGSEIKMVRQIMPGLMSVLTYLCCDNRDVEEPPPVRQAGPKKRQAPPRDPFYVRVGWHIGPKLHAQRVRAQQADSRGGVSVPSGAEYGPQHRAGHYKTVHHGPKKSLQSLRWVDPYWTKRELLEEGEEPSTGIIPVEAQRKDPSERRDIKLANLGTQKAKEIREREAQRQREEDWGW